MAQVYTFTDSNGEVRLMAEINPAPGGSLPSPAIVEVVTLNPWDGAALPFNVIRHDPDGLWDATNHQFVAVTTGWYEAQVFTTIAAGGVSDTVIGGSLFLSVGGPGDNIGAGYPFPIDPAGSSYKWSPFTGITRLRAGDTIDLEGTAGGAFSANNLAFALRLLSTT